MVWVFIPLIVGAGLVAMAVRMWPARATVAEVARALEAVREGTAADASRTPTAAVRGRATAPRLLAASPDGLDAPGEGPLVDPVNGRAVAWWDLRVTTRDGNEARTLYAESSGDSFVVTDETGSVRVAPGQVDLRPGPHVADLYCTLSAEVEGYLQALDPERRRAGTPADAPGAPGAPGEHGHRRRVGYYSVTARHRFVLADAELSVIGRFVAQDDSGDESGDERGDDVQFAVEAGDELPAIVTEQPLSAVVEAQLAVLGRHDKNSGRLLFGGLALLVVAVIKLLDHLS
ncbi:MAG: hypothetical protein JRH11_08475 [Deltaproteobacteria bacterium]|nr:hypothetical protein [Deltaproteobacteria bacterium]